MTKTKTIKKIKKPAKKTSAKTTKTKKAVKKGPKKPVKKTIKKAIKKVKEVVKKISLKDQTPALPPPNPNFKIQTIDDLGLKEIDAEYMEATIKFISENKEKEKNMEKLRKDAYQACHPSYAEKLNERLKEKLGVSIVEMKETLSKRAQEKAEELTVEMKNIAPHADYSKLLETNTEMAQFVREDAHKWENWKVESISQDPKLGALLRVRFHNDAVDEGETMFGVVFVSKSGVIRHSMVQVQE